MKTLILIVFGMHVCAIQDQSLPVAKCKDKINPDNIIVIDEKEKQCLAVTLFLEARGEPTDGKIAVGEVIINRAKKSNMSICTVVLKKNQFSAFNGKDNPNRKIALTPTRTPNIKNSIDNDSWKNSHYISELILKKKVKELTHGATFYISWKCMKSKGYHTPKWAMVYKQVAVIGNHTFYEEPHKKS